MSLAAHRYTIDRFPFPRVALRIIAKHEKRDAERIQAIRTNAAQIQNAKKERGLAQFRLQRLLELDQQGKLFREYEDPKNKGVTIRERDDSQIVENQADIEQFNLILKDLESDIAHQPCLTAGRISALLAKIAPNAVIENCPAEPKLNSGETKQDALARIRRAGIVNRNERDTLLRTPSTKEEMLENGHAQIRAMAIRGQPKVRGLLDGGNIEFAKTNLPNVGTPNFQYVPDGAALVAYLFEPQLLKKVDELIEANAPTDGITRAERDARIAALDTEWLQLRREEAALVEQIKDAWHMPDTPLEALFAISIS